MDDVRGDFLGPPIPYSVRIYVETCASVDTDEMNFYTTLMQTVLLLEDLSFYSCLCSPCQVGERVPNIQRLGQENLGKCSERCRAVWRYGNIVEHVSI